MPARPQPRPAAPHLAAILAAALALSGCGVDACEEWDEARDIPVCSEQRSAIFDDLTEGPRSWCSLGELSTLRSCSDLGYTVMCQAEWVRPEDTGRLPCR